MNIFEEIVPSYFEIDDMEIVILQDKNGELLTIKINYYEHWNKWIWKNWQVSFSDSNEKP